MLIARTFKSSLFQRWSAYLGQNGMTTRNLLHSVMNVQFRNYLLDAEHPIADSDVCLYVLLPVFYAFQLFAQGRHEHPQRSDIVFPTAAPNLLRDIGGTLPTFLESRHSSLYSMGVRCSSVPSRYAQPAA